MKPHQSVHVVILRTNDVHIKITFQYANIYTESYEPEKPPKLELKPNRKTQTVMDDLDEEYRVDYDPFEEEECL